MTLPWSWCESTSLTHNPNPDNTERRPYANGIAQLLDPTGKLFGGRIIAKESLEGGNALLVEKRLMQACSDLICATRPVRYSQLLHALRGLCNATAAGRQPCTQCSDTQTVVVASRSPVQSDAACHSLMAGHAVRLKTACLVFLVKARASHQGLEDLEPVALVIDDSSTVWALHMDSLVTVERYVYFPSSRRSLGMSSSYFEMRRYADLSRPDTTHSCLTWSVACTAHAVVSCVSLL